MFLPRWGRSVLAAALIMVTLFGLTPIGSTRAQEIPVGRSAIDLMDPDQSGDSQPTPSPVEEATATAESTPAVVQPGTNARVVNTGGSGLRVRETADPASAILDVIPEGGVVAVIGGPGVGADGATWAQVQVGETAGWANASYLEPAPADAERFTGSSRGSRASALGDSIAATALDLVGLPYVYGGSSPGSGFDCSGLVRYVHLQFGIGLPRDTDSQWYAGYEVSADAMQPGDVVFFVNTYRAGISHVGIYVGNGKFVDAGTESTGVHVSSIWDPYWSARFYGARRMY